MTQEDSPSTPRKRSSGFGDRFIPARSSISRQNYTLNDGPPSPTTPSSKKRPPSLLDNGTREPKLIGLAGGEVDAVKEESNKTFSSLLSNELLGDDNLNSPTSSSRRQSFSSTSHYQYAPSTPSTPMTPRSKVFQYMPSSGSSLSGMSSASDRVGLDSAAHEKYSISPVKSVSQRLLMSPRKNLRKISKLPYKVLDAPELADDYYLNLLDWSSTNILAVALASTVYIWMAETGQVMTLCNVRELEHADPEESVSSLNWTNKGSQLAIGLRTGAVQIWDVPSGKLLRVMSGHHNRTGTLSWSNHMLASGSRDKSVLIRDVRLKDHYVRRVIGHKQEITGLAYNPAGDMLATGGNDNKLYVWDTKSYNYIHRYTEHEAAVKAISWNPHHRGILASGGGTSDRRILFWDTLKGDRHSIGDWDTGSQVCRLWFSKNTQELVSTHGYSGNAYQNHISIWKYPSMSQVATLTGHTYRVLYLAASPDGQTIVTGSGDETIRFWKAFPSLNVDSNFVAGSINTTGVVRDMKHSESSSFNIKKLIR
ncbi:WD40 repeat-like protein [Wallemia mellicola]|nr:WD40 repeat-like protein [Wallemia mellicola]